MFLTASAKGRETEKKNWFTTYRAALFRSAVMKR
jgi:hypothetical protein